MDMDIIKYTFWLQPLLSMGRQYVRRIGTLRT